MGRLLPALAVVLAAVAALAPLIGAFSPRMNPGIFYRFRLWRRILAGEALGMALDAYVRRPSRGRLAGLSATAMLAALSQVLDPERIFAALDYPPHVGGARARLSPRAEVLGLEVKGAAAAWPLDVLKPHHLVNDHVGPTPVLVSY